MTKTINHGFPDIVAGYKGILAAILETVVDENGQVITDETNH